MRFYLKVASTFPNAGSLKLDKEGELWLINTIYAYKECGPLCSNNTALT